MSATVRKNHSPIDPKRDAIMRTLCASETDEVWDSRSVENKAMIVARGVSERLGGLSNIAYGLSFAEMVKSQRFGDDALRSEYSYFAGALKDMANQLSAAYKEWWKVENDAVMPPANTPPRRKPKPAG
jgi:hypothetical protein